VCSLKGAHLPLAGLLLILPHARDRAHRGVRAPTVGCVTGSTDARHGVDAAVPGVAARPSRRGRHPDPTGGSGRLLGLDRAPEVKTLRRNSASWPAHNAGRRCRRASQKRTPAPAQALDSCTSMGTPGLLRHPGPPQKPISPGCTWPDTPARNLDR